MTGLTLDQLRVFAAVVEEGSFTAASRRLHRAQSAVSYAIANLEAQLEVKLFDRTGKRPVLTSAGKAVLTDARAVMTRTSALLERARWLSTSEEVSLGIGVGALVPMPPVLDQLAAFTKAFPHADLSLYSQPMGGAARLVLDGTADLAIAHLVGDWPDELVVWPLPGVPTALYAAKGHPVVEGGELADHVQIVLSDGSGGKVRGRLSPRTWTVADLHTKKALLERGFGFGTLPMHMAEGLERLTARGFPEDLELSVFAMVHRERPPGVLGRWFLERLGVTL